MGPNSVSWFRGDRYPLLEWFHSTYRHCVLHKLHLCILRILSISQWSLAQYATTLCVWCMVVVRILHVYTSVSLNFDWKLLQRILHRHALQPCTGAAWHLILVCEVQLLSDKRWYVCLMWILASLNSPRRATSWPFTKPHPKGSGQGGRRGRRSSWSSSHH